MGNFEEKYITYFSNDEFNQSAPKWLNNFRLESLNSFKDIGIPKITDEDWRFTDLKAVSYTHLTLPTIYSE